MYDKIHYKLKKKNIGVGSHSLLQGIFPSQGSNLGLLHCRWILDHRATWEALFDICACMCAKLLQSCLFVTPWTVVHQVPRSVGSYRQEYWSGLPCPFPGDLSDSGIEPASPALAGGFFTTSAIWEAHMVYVCMHVYMCVYTYIHRKDFA